MSIPPEASLDDVKVRIRESIKNPNVGKVEQVVLKEGPRAFRLRCIQSTDLMFVLSTAVCRSLRYVRWSRCGLLLAGQLHASGYQR